MSLVQAFRDSLVSIKVVTRLSLLESAKVETVQNS